jgi:hypothetical protein
VESWFNLLDHGRLRHGRREPGIDKAGSGREEHGWNLIDAGLRRLRRALRGGE